ncbi:MAG: hypothetical protein ABFC18_05365 [Rikenellaceae bacterium]|jgi:hypothetical protein|nr:hypothetical protein [Bacteroidales bacterium]
MKTFKTIKFPVIIAFAIVSFFAFSCEKDDNESTVITEDITFSGRMTVDQLDGTNYAVDGVQIKIEPTTSEGILTIEMLQVSFSPRMPVKLDMQIQDVIYYSSSKKIIISGNNIIPIAMGGEFPAYTITNLSGEIENGSITLSMMCGNYPLTYSGTLQL